MKWVVQGPKPPDMKDKITKQMDKVKKCGSAETINTLHPLVKTIAAKFTKK